MPRSRWLARLVALLAGAGVVTVVPAWWCGRRADAFFDGDLGAQRALASGVREWLERDPATLTFGTGSPRFDGEWYLITHVAAAIGLAQTALEHPELGSEHARLVERAIDRALLPRGRAHDALAWSEDPLEALDGDRGHLAFLGYANLALSMHRRLEPRSRFSRLNDEITAALARRFARHGSGALLESYPAETYPADNAAAIASIALHDRAAGGQNSDVVQDVLSAFSTRYRDPRSGFLYQRVDSETGAPRDAARASGTALAAFVLGAAGLDAARPLWRSLARQFDDVLGFGGVREYGPGDGAGDVDSGPVIFGLGVSASGFALAAARRHGDRERFRGLFASAWLFGLPYETKAGLRFVSGGAVGDTLLFALLTAGRAR
ncbi:MAG: hypothetical protein HYY06_08450 [Deltaproteobacteria bacterium]|nr:hypothetical protein [Deltaproteobacteria bacterium]